MSTGRDAIIAHPLDGNEAAAALRASEERFRAAVNITSSLIWTNTAEGMMEGEQPGWGSFTGQSQVEYQGYGWSHAVHPEDAQPTIDAWRQAVAAKRIFEFEHRVRRHDGEWRLCSIRAIPLLNADGTIREWVGVHTDITERKRAEEALRKTHQRLETVLASITDGLAVLDKDWRYTYFSEQAARIIGMEAGQLLGQCVWDLFPAAKETKFYEAYHRAVETGERVEFEEFLPEPINMWLECHCYPSAEGLSVYFHEITRRKQAEETLKRNQSLFSAIIDQAPGGVYVVDDQFRTLQVNALARPTFAAAEPVIGRDFREVMHILWGPEVGGELADIFRHTLDTGERYVSPRFAGRRTDLGLEKAYDWEAQRLTLPNGKCGVVCYFSDVTAQYELEHALRDAKEAAEIAAKAKDDFLAALSHELRTPLTPVLMTAAALREDDRLPSDAREQLRMMERNIALESRLIDDLLDLTRIAKGKLSLRLQPCDAHLLINLAVEIIRDDAQVKGITLERTFAAERSGLVADPARFQQVIWNLLRNAVKFTPPGGHIAIRTRNRAGADGAGELSVEVQDSGIGIAAEALTKIFLPFDQGHIAGDHRFGGLGLGLSIARAIVELHGGVIHAQSDGPGRGATFFASFPGATGPPHGADDRISPFLSAPHTAPSPSAPAGNHTGLRLLLVEDHEATLTVLTRLLVRAGHHVRTARTISDALLVAAAEPFDAVISDLGLPDGTGTELMGQLRDCHGLRGIALSGYGMEEDVTRSHEAGFITHLTKPVDFSQLENSLRELKKPKPFG